MKNFLKALPRYVWLQVLVAIIGLILSVVLHELFHIVMHWGEVPRVGLFPNHEAIVEILLWQPHGYDLEGEEIAAYGITLLVWLLTIVFIFWIRDAHDKRSAGQILFPNDKKLQKMNTQEMLELSGQANDLPVAPKPRAKKQRK